jgi:hypothetical protein
MLCTISQILAVLLCVQPDARSLALIFAVHSPIQALREIDNTKLLELFAVPFADHFPFAFLAGFSPGSFERICNTISIMPLPSEKSRARKGQKFTKIRSFDSRAKL